MKSFVVILAVLLCSQCGSQPVDESVVSVYTTQTTTSGTAAPLDVYHQIANNIAERITSPIYRLFGYNSTTTVPPPTTKQGLDHIELSDDQDIPNNQEIKPVNNDISQDRDVEELSVEALQKVDKKPEKITLFSRYLPITSSNDSEVAASNDNKANTPTDNDDDDDDDFDSLELDSDDEKTKPREGGLIYWMELLGSIIQLLWGGLVSLFRPSSSESS